MGKHETVSVEEYKRRAADLLDQMMSGAVSHVTVLDGGRVVAEVDEGQQKPKWSAEEEARVLARLRGSVRVPPGVDLTEPDDEDWDALKDDPS